MTFDYLQQAIKIETNVWASFLDKMLYAMPKDEFLKIPIVGDDAKDLILKYGWVFAIHAGGNNNEYWNVYVNFPHILREKEPKQIPHN